MRTQCPRSGTSSFSMCQGGKPFQEWALQVLSCDVRSRVLSRETVIQSFLEVDALLELRIPPLSIGAIRPLGDFIPCHPLFTLQASSASAGLVTAMSATLPACWSLFTDQSRTPVTSCTGCGVCTHSPNDAEPARLWSVQQHTVWPEERGVAARLCDLEYGTYFPVG